MPRRPALSDPTAFAMEFLKQYLQPGFGRMSKRDIDLLVLNLLDRHSELGELDDWEVARRIGSTPSKVRTLRADGRYLFLDDEAQQKLLHDGFFAALDGEHLQRRADGRLELVLSDPFVRDGIRARCEALGDPSDHAFNRDRLFLTLSGFIDLCRDLLTEKEQELLRSAYDTARLFPADTLWERVRRSVTDEKDRVDPRRVVAVAKTITGDLKALEAMLE